MALRTAGRLEQQLLSSQAPFAVQPRVFDERFPKFILYVQDVEAAATHWQGVFLASSAGATSGLIPQSGDHSQQSSVTIAEEAQIITNPAQHQIDLHLGAAALTSTTSTRPINITSLRSAKRIFPWIFPGRVRH